MREKESTIKRLVVLLALSLLFIVGLPSAGAGPPSGTVVQTHVGNLDFPVDMAWERGTKRIFFTEQDTGKIRVVVGSTLIEQPCRILDVAPNYEQGLLGITLHPDFDDNDFLYVYFTKRAPRENRIVRYVVENNRCTERALIVKDIPAKIVHNGGQLEFVDGKLFVSTGDANVPANAYDLTLDQDPEAKVESSLAGKILRYNDDGTIPDDNPYVGVAGHNPAIWSYGHRNGFGLANRGGTSLLFETENGPRCHDEVNLIEPGVDYGWPPADIETCTGYRPGSREPLARWNDTIAPTDAHWYDGRLEAFEPGLYFGDFNFGKIHFLDMSADGTQVLNGDRGQVVYDGRAPIIDVAKGPGGWFYFLTPSAIKRIRTAP